MTNKYIHKFGISLTATTLLAVNAGFSIIVQAESLDDMVKDQNEQIMAVPEKTLRLNQNYTENLEVISISIDKDIYLPTETPQLTVVIPAETDIDYVSIWFLMKESGGYPPVIVDNFETDELTGNYIGTTTLDLSNYAFGETDIFYPLSIEVYAKSGNVTEIINDYYFPETVNPAFDASFMLKSTTGKAREIIVPEYRTEKIDFEIEYVNNPNLYVGTEKISQKGVEGVQKIKDKVTIVGGIVTEREFISSEMIQAPVNQVVQVGTKALKPEIISLSLDKDVYLPTETPQLAVVIPAKTDIDYVSIWFGMKESGGYPTVIVDNFEADELTGNYIGTTTLDLSNYAFGETDIFYPFSIEVYDKTGNVTEIYNDYYFPETVNPAFDASFMLKSTTGKARKIIVPEYRTEKIDFEIEYVNNPNLFVGTERISQKGVEGVRKIKDEVTIVGGIVTEREFTSSEMIQAPVKQVVEVGTKAAEIKDNATIVTVETHTEEVSFETEYIKNPDLMAGTEEVSQEGILGERKITEEVKIISGEEVSRKVISSDLIIAPINKVIQVGTKAVIEETEDEEPNNTEKSENSVDSTDRKNPEEDLPQTGAGSTTITSILGTLAIGLGTALDLKRRKKVNKL